MEIIVKETSMEMSQRQYEGLLKYAEIIQWGRENPISFCETVLGIYLLDYQRYMFMNSWTATSVLWCCSRSSGKSFLSAPYIMSRSILFPNHVTYIVAGTASQSADTFMKIEQTAKKQIASLTSLTDIFGNELVRTNSSSNGFVKDENTHSCELYNGSKIKSLSGAYDRNRGEYLPHYSEMNN